MYGDHLGQYFQCFENKNWGKLCQLFQTHVYYRFYPIYFCNHWKAGFNSFPMIVGFLVAPVEKIVALK